MERRILAPLLAAAACMLGVLLLAFLTFEVAPVISLDVHALERLSAPHGGARYDTAVVVARLVDPLPYLLMTVAVIGFGLGEGRRRAALVALAMVLGANLTTQVLKGLLADHRAHEFLTAYQPWSNAFPSGHTTAAAVLGIALVLVAPTRLRRPAALAAGAFAGAVGLAVVVIEWHYPSDVLGGLLVAAGWGFAALVALRLATRRDRAGAQASSVFAISTK